MAAIELASEWGETAAAVGAKSHPRRVGYLLNFSIFLTLLIIVASAMVPYGTWELRWEIGFTTLIFCLAGLRLLEGLLSDNCRISSFGLIVPLLLLCGFCLLQTLSSSISGQQSANFAGNLWWAISADPYESRRFALKLLALVLGGEMLTRYTSSSARLRVFAYAVIAVGVVSGLAALFQAVPKFELSLTSVSVRRLWQFGNLNHFSLLLEMIFGVLLGLIAGAGIRRDHLLIYGSMTLIVWATIPLTTSRGGIVTMFCVLLFVAAFSSGVRGRSKQNGFGRRASIRHVGQSWMIRSVLLASLLIVVAIGVVKVGGDPMVSKLDKIPGELNPSSQRNSSRLNFWRATWQLIKDHPLAGSGFGAYWIAISPYYDSAGHVVPYQAHNDYLELLASGGIIGTLLVVWFVIVLVKRAREQLRSPDRFRRAVCFGALAGLFAAAVHSAFDFGLHNNVNALVFMSLVVLATSNVPWDSK